MVNRLWQRYFGRGLVGTPNDFGLNGEKPTHPELLDWLATEFTRRGWSLKKMHALIVTSNAYRQVSMFDAVKAKRDPENRLLWRQNRRRLDAEALRDSILSVAGTLNLQMGGESVRVPLEPEVVDTIFTEAEPDNLWPVHPDPRQHTRRSLYLVRKRNVRLPMLAVFDQPDMMLPCAARGQSVSALQSLTLLNSPFMQQQSQEAAHQLLVSQPKEENRIHSLFLEALNRPPTERERKATLRFLRDQTALVRQRLQRGETVATPASLPPQADRATAAAWADLCLAMFNLNDFVMVK